MTWLNKFKKFVKPIATKVISPLWDKTKQFLSSPDNIKKVIETLTGLIGDVTSQEFKEENFMDRIDRIVKRVNPVLNEVVPGYETVHNLYETGKDLVETATPLYNSLIKLKQP
jgi:hypothetical protein